MRLYILKHCHYSTFFPKFHRFKDNKKSITVSFNKSCLYEIEEESCVNKLWGFASGFGVHKNSFRFGWSAVGDKIQVWIYTYTNGKLNKQKVMLCDLDTEYTFSLEIKGHEVLFYINDQLLKMKPLKCSPKFLTELGFYFGGKSRAPHTMWIDFNYESK